MLEARGLKKAYGDFAALGPVTFTLGSEHVVGVVGPSGCGKSTLLRVIAGLDAATAGALRLDGERIIGPRPDVAVVFQEPRLLPWASVRKNIALGLWDVPEGERREAVDAALAKVELTEFADALPKQLSGGMAQRVGIARALVRRPRLLLLDEPFAALDPLTRLRMQDHLLEMVGTDVPNVIIITHDIDEALVLSDRIVVMQGPPGQILADLVVDLPKPRRRTSLQFQSMKGEILDLLFGPATRAA
ncbi:MAG: ABC transporter ATP-binding protein [Mesorhizobium sp.]